jgi:hypothetical protein
MSNASNGRTRGIGRCAIARGIPAFVEAGAQSQARIHHVAVTVEPTSDEGRPRTAVALLKDLSERKPRALVRQPSLRPPDTALIGD